MSDPQQYPEQSELVSTSAIFSQSIRGQSSMTPEQEDQVRAFYESCFQRQITEHRDQPLWFKLQFEQIGQQVFHNLMTENLGSRSIQECCIRIQFNFETLEFPNRRMISVGRFSGCDLQLPAVNGCSRLHLMILTLPEIQKAVFLDVGSIAGIALQGRTGEDP